MKYLWRDGYSIYIFKQINPEPIAKTFYSLFYLTQSQTVDTDVLDSFTKVMALHPNPRFN